ncbi:MAG: MinD/ParA family protein [Pseudomonadota bacterium]
MDNSVQAAQMRDAVSARPTKVIAVTSGKGGVGKTNVSVNLSVALAERGRDVMLMDADLSLANVDVLLGLQPTHNLAHLIRGEADLEQTIVTGPAGVRIVPAASGDRTMADLPQASQAAIISSFSQLERQPDILIVDTAAGLAENVARFAQAAQHALVVVCDEPASITDAYALIKVFSRDYGIRRFHVLSNMSRSRVDGRELFEKLLRVTDRFLDVVLTHAGTIPADGYLKKSVQEQRAVVAAYPDSWSAKAFDQLAEKVDAWKQQHEASGGLKFFFERLLQEQQRDSARRHS